MRKIRTGLAALLSAVSLTAGAFTTTVHVDHPEYVTIRVDWNDVTITQGENVINWEESLGIDPRDSYNHKLTGITTEDGTDLLGGSSSYYCSKYVAEDIDGKTLYVTSCHLDDLRTGEVTVTLDNPKRFSYIATDGYPNVQLPINKVEAGKPYTLKYMPGVNNTIQFNTNGAPVYKITKNGEVVEPNEYGSYYIPLEHGADIKAYGDYPDVTAKVEFTFLNEAAQLFDKAWSIDTGYVKHPLEMKDNVVELPIGWMLQIDHKINYADYTVATYTYGAQTLGSVYLNHSFYVTSEHYPVVIDAVHSTPQNITVTINDAKGVKVNKKEREDVLALEDGENKVVVYETNNQLSIAPWPGYSIEEVILNDDPLSQNWDGTYVIYQGNLKEGDKVDIKVKANATYTAVIHIEDASLVKLTRNYDNYNMKSEYALQNGANEITCSAGNNTFRVEASPNGYINSVNLNGDEDVRANYDGSYEFKLEEDYEAVITAEPVVNEGDLVVYVDNLSAANLTSFYYYTQNGRVKDEAMGEGYNVRPSFHGHNSHTCSAYYVWQEPKTMAVYQNGVRKSPKYDDSTDYQLDVAAGDVIRIYLATDAPESHTVDFTVDSETADGLAYANVVRDMIVPVEPNGSETVLDGTRYQFNVAGAAQGDDKVVVLANDTALEPDETGLYTLDVKEPVTVKLAYGLTVGIGAVGAEDAAAEYYTTSGVRLRSKPTAPGVYVEVKGGKASKVVK